MAKQRYSGVGSGRLGNLQASVTDAPLGSGRLGFDTKATVPMATVQGPGTSASLHTLPPPALGLVIPKLPSVFPSPADPIPAKPAGTLTSPSSGITGDLITRSGPAPMGGPQDNVDSLDAHSISGSSSVTG